MAATWKGPSGSKSPRISVTMNSSEASLAHFKRERVINEDHREVNEDDYLNILTAHANLRLSGAQETLFTPLVSQLDDLMPAKVPMSMTSCGTQQHAVSPKKPHPKSPSFPHWPAHTSSALV